jgi:predicted peptidase
MQIVTWSLNAAAVLCGAGCAAVALNGRVQVGQHPASFEKTIAKTVRANYWLYIPETYPDSRASWPLMLFLHGAGERGDDLSLVEKHGPPKLVAKEGKSFPFIIVSPQCPADGWWSSETQIDTLNALLDDIVSRYRIDEDRIYVTGLSMGGFGTWRLAAAYPHRFAAIAPVCGGGNPKDAASIAHLPIWVFHGAKDPTVKIAESERMVAALKEVGADVAFTVYPDAGHDSWTETYNNPELYEWLLKHRR